MLFLLGVCALSIQSIFLSQLTEKKGADIFSRKVQVYVDQAEMCQKRMKDLNEERKKERTVLLTLEGGSLEYTNQIEICRNIDRSYRQTWINKTSAVYHAIAGQEALKNLSYVVSSAQKVQIGEEISLETASWLDQIIDICNTRL